MTATEQTSTSPHFQHLLAGMDALETLDLLDHPSTGSPEQHALADRLLRQAHGQGLSVQPREAHLVARLLLNAPVASGLVAEEPPLSPAVLRSFRKPPTLIPTQAEQADIDQYRRDPTRRRKCIRQGLMAGIATFLSAWGANTLWEHPFAQYHGIPGWCGLLMVLGLTWAAGCGLGATLCSFTEAVLALTYYSPFDRRVDEAYKARLWALSAAHLQAVADMLRSHEGVGGRLTALARKALKDRPSGAKST